jgi:hypothetical protein
MRGKEAEKRIKGLPSTALLNFCNIELQQVVEPCHQFLPMISRVSDYILFRLKSGAPRLSHFGTKYPAMSTNQRILLDSYILELVKNAPMFIPRRCCYCFNPSLRFLKFIVARLWYLRLEVHVLSVVAGPISVKCYQQPHAVTPSSK